VQKLGNHLKFSRLSTWILAGRDGFVRNHIFIAGKFKASVTI
jgi:hypothetical protein